MPEGHTIHRLARRHRKLFAGTKIAASSPQGRFADGARILHGQELVETTARGKHLFYEFEDGEILHVHLGLIGRFRTYTREPPDPTDATRLVVRNDVATAYLSGPMVCDLVEPEDRDDIIGELGPDPLYNRTDGSRIFAALQRRRIPIGAALLDQSIVCGIGNVYRSEILFLCGIDPRRESRSLSEEEVACVWETARTQLRLGVNGGRIVTVDPADVGARNRRQLKKDERLYVYHRDEQPCRRCGTSIQKTELGGRHAWFCPEEQG